MKSQISLKEKSTSTEALNDLIIDSIQDIKGEKIVKLDLRKLDESPTDFFIICEANSNTQVGAIAGNIQKRLKLEVNVQAAHVEGTQNALWVCLDYFTTVVHVFYKETREFYQLDALWNDAKKTEYNDL